MHQCSVCKAKILSTTWCPKHPFDELEPVAPEPPTRRMPDGSTTRDVNAYLDSWHALAAPIEVALDWKLLAFNPGFIFAVTLDGVETHVDLTTAVVRDMAEKLHALRARGG